MWQNLQVGTSQRPDDIFNIRTIHIQPYTWCVHQSLSLYIIKKIKSVAYSSQGSHTGQLDFCNWLADRSTTG